MTEVFCVNNKKECNIFKDSSDTSEKLNIIERKCNIYGGILEKDQQFNKLCRDSPMNLQENNIKILKDRDIIDAIKNDHLNRFIKLLEESNRDNNINLSIDYNYNGNTLLHEAIFWNSNRCILYLLKQCSEMINKTNKDDNTVLHIACLKGNSFLINELCNLGSNISSVNKRGETILHCAIKSGKYEVVDNVFNIIQNINCLNCVDNKGRNALHIATICKNKTYDIINFLIQNGSNIINKDYSGFTIMTNLNRLEKNSLNLRIKTLLTKSFHDIYQQKTYNDGNIDNFYEKKFNDFNVDPKNGCYNQNIVTPEKSENGSKKYINLYSYKLCQHPEYAPFILKNNKNTTYKVINTYNVKYDKEDTELLKEKDPIKKKVLPIKFKKYFEDFEDYGNKLQPPVEQIIQTKKQSSNYMFSKIVSVCVIVFLILFLFIYE